MKSEFITLTNYNTGNPIIINKRYILYIIPLIHKDGSEVILCYPGMSSTELSVRESIKGINMVL